MGLASALSTALTGLSASETTIDVVGNNLANANTVGFKQSEADFATQFLQTMSLGSAPTNNSGGTNPRQTGLGTQVAEITPDFTQGTIQHSSSPTDLAIQGEGFFIVRGDAGENLYTRNGVFKLNSENEMVSITGQRLLGYGVDINYEIDTSGLSPIAIPLGSAAVAQATRNVYLEGQLSPTGDIATKAEQIQTASLSDGSYTAPDGNGTASLSSPPIITNVTRTSDTGGALTPDTTYEYKFVYANTAYTPPPAEIPDLSESSASELFAIKVEAGNNAVTFGQIPTPSSTAYTKLHIYRRVQGAADTAFHFVAEIPSNQADYTDKLSDLAAAANPTLNEDKVTGKYRYYVTFATAPGGPPNGIESRPCLDKVPATVNVNGRVLLTNLPTADAGDIWKVRRVYRCLATNENEFHYLGEISDATSNASITDNVPDADIKNRATINMDGPVIGPGTKLTNVLRRDTNGFTQLFHVGTLEFTGQKAGRSLATKNLTISAETTALDLANFMSQAMGIQQVGTSATDNPDVDATPGGSIDGDGRVILTGNNGVDNRINIPLSGMTNTYIVDGTTINETVDMRWSEKQQAVGTGAITDTVVYDSLGTSLPLRVTMILSARTGTETTYRWFADCADNSYGTTPTIAVGTGEVTFDTSGNFKRAYQDDVNIYRDGFPTVNPLTFKLDFNNISGLATESNSLAVSRQDGSASGTLTSYIVGEDGVITGVFSNGISRNLAQIRLARFANAAGLEQRGLNLFAAGVNSGLPVQGNPGIQGIGKIVAGAVELSNTDVGGSLIDLITASTMYRGNARVITTVQQMFDELMNLRR